MPIATRAPSSAPSSASARPRPPRRGGAVAPWCAIAALFLALALVLPGAGGGAVAQVPGPGGVTAPADNAANVAPPAIDAESPEAVREAVSRLSDEQVRALLLDRLDAVARARAEARGDGLGSVVAGAADSLGVAVGSALDRVENIPDGLAEGVGRFYAPRGATGTLHLLAVLFAALGLGHLAELLVGRLMPAALPPDAGRGRPPLRDTLGFLLRRFVHEGLGLAAFIAAAWGVMVLAYPPEPISYLVLTFFLFGPVLLTRLAVAIGRFGLAPGLPAQRLLRLDDAAARFLFLAVTVFAALVGLRMYVLSFLGGHGVDLAALRLGFWLSLAIHGWLVYVVWTARRPLAAMLLPEGEATPAEGRVAAAAPVAAVALIALVWALGEIFVAQGLWQLLDGRLPLTLAILLGAPVSDVAIRALAAHGAPDPDPGPDPGADPGAALDQAPGGAAAEPARALARRTRQGYVRMGRVLVLVVLILVLVDLWNVDVTTAAMGPLPARAAIGLVEALAVLAVGYFLLEAVTLWFLRRIAAETPTAPAAEADAGGEGGGAGGSRLSTVLPLLMRAAQAAIVVVTLFEALSALGVSIAPLLAGLGILGLAIGFGAQKLVADIVSGIFFLIDDAFRVGEYVEIDGTFGTVERISLRSLILRHHLGKVHTIPFGEIPKLTNYSRDWVIMKLRFTVPFDTDLMKVKRLFKQIGRDMMADPAFAVDFLQPFKSQGVLEVDDVGIVIRGKFMARPGRQWVLRKEIYQRVQQAFEANGIDFARREVRVKIDDGPAGEAPGTLSAAARQQAATAAAEAAIGDAEGRATAEDTRDDGPGT